MVTKTIPLTEQENIALQTIAQQTGKSQSDLLQEAVQRLITDFQENRRRYWQRVTKRKRTYRTETARQQARARFEGHFGALALAFATGADNESIDADLARAYANDYEEN